MKILTMTATFGCLDEATLHLTDGVNRFTLPNESGKSTWAAFLQAMFYGIDTSQRASKGVLPEKTRWQPWNGKAMCGTIELEHRGQTIVLQRTSQRGRPMSVFHAYDKHTGLELPELTGENCGMYFFGVEKSVFQRSAVLSGSELAVTEHQELARRLENLAVSGSMGDSFPAADAKLKQWKNRIRYHQNGLIPEKEAQLLQAEGRVERLSELRQQTMEASAAYETIKTEAETLEQAEQRRWEEKIHASHSNYLDAMQRWEQAEEFWAENPYYQYLLQDLREDLLRLQENPKPSEWDGPPALQGLAGDAVMPKAEQDQAACERLLARAKMGEKAWMPLCLGFGLLALIAVVCRIWWLLPVCLCGIGAGLWLRRRAAVEKQKAEELLQSYGASDAEGIWHEGKLREKWFLLQERHEFLYSRVEEKLEKLRRADEPLSMEDLTLDWIEQTLAKCGEKEKVQLSMAVAKMEFIKADTPFPPSLELMKLREKAAGLKAQADSLRQQEEVSGGLETARYRCEQLRGELDDLYLREQALELAREALASAHSQLERVYAPQLTGLAGEYLQKLTGSRYDALILGKDWQLQVREQATGLARPLTSLSSGTKDQVWLSLRLSMAKLLLPADAPLVLDDALLTFDEARTAAALEVLLQSHRQVLLFSCRAK